MSDGERQKREAIVEHCKALNRTGLNQGTSGNISIRHEEGMLISPTSRPYDSLMPEDVVFVDKAGNPTGHFAPSSEWRFHRDILLHRDEVNAVVHAHPTYCTTLAIMGKSIPPIHYMLAVFGGSTIRCAPYEIYGSPELSELAVKALEDRKACLLAHHGMIAVGSSIEQAFWLAGELEALAKQYHGCLQLGEPPLLSEQQIQDVIAKISEYGLTSVKSPENKGLDA
ncbi:class II aldolase/adducin family protein [Hoeflea prorocentri]|uniref:Class II aldolase/adducin family protein n=1 Tax=Hoeflea prorocentri TaxID=1922333 RepID=A0A9X3UJ04_9HYPH|nr:class II aldolase/adducin family protein [Hoeflea prorocentri]MCY6381549.1 class II aldolase/adducin family protein [Hoeflea prorocentri]MDA5399349.1 class II aldolase/adducin family protein [Hoeflea prorocentri]